jgi:hypothetical protein
MRFPQVLIYERDGKLIGPLRELARDHQWTLREVRSAESCLRLLRVGGANVLVLVLGPDPVKEMRLLERCTWLVPDAPVVLVSDTEHPGITNLAWDLGAAVVLGPRPPHDRLPEIVAGLMERFGRKK